MGATVVTALGAAGLGADVASAGELALALRAGIPADRIVFAGGRVFDASDPAKGVSFQDAIILGETMHGTLGTTGSYKPPPSAGTRMPSTRCS